MNRKEFIEYLEFLGMLFPNAKIPGVNVKTNDCVRDAWYDEYKKISLTHAKEMAKEYLKTEKGIFNYARLLEHNHTGIDTDETDMELLMEAKKRRDEERRKIIE